MRDPLNAVDPAPFCLDPNTDVHSLFMIPLPDRAYPQWVSFSIRPLIANGKAFRGGDREEAPSPPAEVYHPCIVTSVRISPTTLLVGLFR